MKFNRESSHQDSNNSFLDVIFCVCVTLCLALVAKSSFISKKKSDIQRESLIETVKVEELTEIEVVGEEVEELIEIEVVEQINKNIRFVRFSESGGQPKLKTRLHYGLNGLTVLIGNLELPYVDFRKIICNIDRKESDGQPYFLFSTMLSNGYVEATVYDVYDGLDEKISIDIIKKEKEKDSIWWIVNLYKMRYSNLEKRCRKFKLDNTSLYLGNWDFDRIVSKNYSSYESRKDKGKPFIWFSVDNEEEAIIMGPKEDPVVISPVDFLIFMSNIEEIGGLYLECRNCDSLKLKKDLEVPSWFVNKVMNPLGYKINF